MENIYNFKYICCLCWYFLTFKVGENKEGVIRYEASLCGGKGYDQCIFLG